MPSIIYEPEMVRLGIHNGSLLVKTERVFSYSKEEVDRRALTIAPLVRELTLRARSMTVHGLEEESFKKWSATVQLSLKPTRAKETWTVDAGAELFKSEIPFICNIPRRGRHCGVFVWLLPAAETCWLGSELQKLASLIACTKPYGGMFDSTKRQTKSYLKSQPDGLVVEFGRFADSFRVVTNPPMPQTFVDALFPQGI